MTRPSLAFAFALALLASACAHKSSARKTSDAQAQTQAKAPKEQFVCYNEQPTGSHIAKTVCYTQEQLGEMTQAAQDLLRQASQTSSTRQAPNGGVRPTTRGGR